MLPVEIQPDDFPVPFGPFVLLRLLGQGAHARVFLGELRGMAGFRKLVALKIIHKSYGDRADRFIREGRLCGLLKHRNIVDTYQMGVEDGQIYIAMEPVLGVNLATLIQRGALPASVVLEIGLEICRGLAYAHQLKGADGPLGLVHRDLKPGNILVGLDGAVKLADFGIASLTQRDGAPRTTAGSPGYMSPEQWEKRPLDGRSDLFSLCVVLAEMSVGGRLHSGEVADLRQTVLDIESRLQKSDLIGRVEACVPGLGAVLTKGLVIDPERRFRGAEELAAQLRVLQKAVDREPRLEDWLKDSIDRSGSHWQPGFSGLISDEDRSELTPSAPDTLELSVVHEPDSKESESVSSEERIELGDRFIDLSARKVLQGSAVTTLTPKEVALIRYLSKRPFAEVSTKDLLQHVWEYHPNTHTRAVHHSIQRLRRKLEADTTKPKHLITVRGFGYRFEPVVSEQSVPDLPKERSAFIGRREALQALTDRFAAGVRLVTLLGIGGAGKTRFARAFGRTCSWRVLFIDLTHAKTADDIVAEALNAAEVEPGTDPQGQWLRILKHLGQVLVVADNFESVVQHAKVLGTWLDAVPSLNLLVTSRETLGIDGEAVMDLGPLSVKEGVALLLDRCRMIGALSPLEEDDARRIVKQVDGIPLAIELAAAQLRFQNVTSLIARLETEVHSLTQLSRDGLARHASLSAALMGSWSALTPERRQALSQCALFHGGFTTHAAQSVVQSGIGVLRALLDLRNGAMVTSRETGRLDLLEPVRQFVLAQSPPSPDAVERHARWVYELLKVHARKGYGVLWAERANIRVAIERCALVNPDLAASLILIGKDVFWEQGTLAWIFEPMEQVEQALNCVETKLEIGLVTGSLSIRNQDFRRSLGLMTPIYEQAVESGFYDIACRAASQAHASTNYLGGKTDAEWFDKLQSLEDRVSDHVRPQIWKAYCSRAMREDDYPRALDYTQRVTASVRTQGDKNDLPNALNSEAWSLLYLARPIEAKERLQEAKELAQRFGLQHTVAVVQGTLGFAMLQTGDPDGALRWAQTSIEAMRSWGRPVHDYFYFTAAMASALLGQEDSALVEAERARKGGRTSMVGETALLQGSLHQKNGQIDAALREFREAKRVFQQIGEARYEAMADWMWATARAEGNQGVSKPDVAAEVDAILAAPLGPRVSDTQARTLHGLCQDHVQFVRTGESQGLHTVGQILAHWAAEPHSGELPAHWMWTRLRHQVLVAKGA